MTISSATADPVRVDEPVALVRAVSHVYGTSAHSTTSTSRSRPAAWSA